MKLDTEQFLTINEAVKAIGAPNRKAVYRSLKRAEAAGRVLYVEAFGKTLIPVKHVEELKEYYYPYYSEAHQRMVKEWGRRGGTQKGINRRKAQPPSVET